MGEEIVSNLEDDFKCFRDLLTSSGILAVSIEPVVKILKPERTPVHKLSLLLASQNGSCLSMRSGSNLRGWSSA